MTFNYTGWIDNERRFADNELTRFKAKMKEDPQAAFEWSKTAFQAAARKHVADVIAELIPGLADDPQRVVKWLRSEMLTRARFPEHSTSPPSDYAAQCLLAALAQALATMDPTS